MDTRADITSLAIVPGDSCWITHLCGKFSISSDEIRPLSNSWEVQVHKWKSWKSFISVMTT